MNYHAFFQDVISWMDNVNEVVKQHSIFTNEYWDYVIKTSGELCNKYGNHPLVVAQMGMLITYLDNVYKQQGK